MGSGSRVSFAMMGPRARLEALSRRLSSERSLAKLGEGRKKKEKRARPPGYISRTVWDLYFDVDGTEAARRRWRPPAERWLEHREGKREKAWKRAPWAEGEAGGQSEECRRADGRRR